MLKISKEKFGMFDSIVINNPEIGIEIELITEFGAVINKFIFNHSPFSFISGYQTSDELINEHPYFSRSAKLFPFPNRLKHGRYCYKGHHYQLPANFPWSEHAVHGLLYNQPFQLLHCQASAQSAEVDLRFTTPCLHPGYPFAFQIDIRFSITIDGLLSCTTTVENQGVTAMPFGDAWHPYFSLGAPLSKCSLTMPFCHELEHIDDMPTGLTYPNEQFLQATSLDGVTLNHCFYFDNSNPIQLSLQRQDHVASLNYQQDPSYPYLQLYTPNSEASIAIEPMSCPADAFNHHIGLLELAPKQRQTFRWQCQANYQPR
ncbi:aldose 1-epimerase [Vibrio navarrensis]|nr:aldose 1-epimerase [Vibrio navarrensis]